MPEHPPLLLDPTAPLPRTGSVADDPPHAAPTHHQNEHDTEPDPDADFQPVEPARRRRGRRARGGRVPTHRRRWLRRRDPGRHRRTDDHRATRGWAAEGLRRWWLHHQPRHATGTPVTDRGTPLWQPGTCPPPDPHDTWTGGHPR